MITIMQTSDHHLVASLAEGVQNLHHSLHPELFKPFDKDATIAAMEAFLSDPACRAYVAYNHDIPVGYVIAYIRDGSENAFHYAVKSVYVDQIAVLQEHQRSGAGRQLLETVEELAKQHAIAKIELDHWTSNVVAAAYFRKSGYVLRKERLSKYL